MTWLTWRHHHFHSLNLSAVNYGPRQLLRVDRFSIRTYYAQLEVALAVRDFLNISNNEKTAANFICKMQLRTAFENDFPVVCFFNDLSLPFIKRMKYLHHEFRRFLFKHTHTPAVSIQFLYLLHVGIYVCAMSSYFVVYVSRVHEICAFMEVLTLCGLSVCTCNNCL